MENDRWVGSREAAKFIGCSQRHLTERLRRREGFPAAATLSSGGRDFRWRLSELDEWMESTRKKKVGRPRNNDA